MLKLLDELTELAHTHMLISDEYRARVSALKLRIRDRVNQNPLLSTYNISATEDGEIRIEPSVLKFRNGQAYAEGITISPDALLQIAAVLEEEVL